MYPLPESVTKKITSRHEADTCSCNLERATVHASGKSLVSCGKSHVRSPQVSVACSVLDYQPDGRVYESGIVQDGHFGMTLMHQAAMQDKLEDECSAPLAPEAFQAP